MRNNPLKTALAAGLAQTGAIAGQFRSPEIARIYKAAGFDWIFVDTDTADSTSKPYRMFAASPA